MVERRLPLGAEVTMCAYRCGIAGLILFCFCLSSAALQAAETDPPPVSRRVVVALLPFETKEVDPALGPQATAQFLAALRQIREIVLVEASQVDALLRDIHVQGEICTGLECAQRIGKELGLRKVLIGTVEHRDPLRLTLSTTLVDVDSGTGDRTASIEYEGAFAPLAATGIPILARRVLGLPAVDAPGMTVAIEQATARPVSTPEPSRTTIQTRDGFALYTGWMNYSGVTNVKGMGDVVYSGDAIPTLGFEYQWHVRDIYTVALFYENGTGSVSGKLGDVYDEALTALTGVEVRRWTDNWYLGANLAVMSTCLGVAQEKKSSPGSICFMGPSVGGAVGRQWPSGWFVSGSLQYAVPDASSENKSDTPRVGSAAEYDGWVNVGYRWGQP